MNQVESALSDQFIPMRGMRGIIANNMKRSLSSSAQLTLHRKADITSIDTQRKTFVENFGIKVTLTDILAKVVAQELIKTPGINGWVQEDTLILKNSVHMGIATAIPGGLIVPVVKDIQKKPLSQAAEEIHMLAEKARSGCIKPAECVGSTFTITNLGADGIEYFTPIINPPEIGILGVGIASMEQVYDKKNHCWHGRLLLPLSLTFDHCSIDGAPAAEILNCICTALASVQLETLQKKWSTT